MIEVAVERKKVLGARNRKLFWKEMSKVNGGKVESCSRMNNGSWHWEEMKYE